MLNTLLFILTCIAYIGLIYFNLSHPKGTGDQLMGWGLLFFLVLKAYVVCSLLLTINIAFKGGFDWIAESNIKKFIIVSIGWLSLMAGIVYITFKNGDWRPGTSNLLGLVIVDYGALWIPLLMLIPFAIFSNPSWSNAISPNIYKIPLFVGCIIGLAFLFIPKQQISKLLKNQMAIDHLDYEKAVRKFNDQTEPRWILYDMWNNDNIRIKKAAVDRLKALEKLEPRLVSLLEECVSNEYYFYVYDFLEHYEIKEPALFVKPLNKTILLISKEFKNRSQSDLYYDRDYMNSLHLDGLCRVLEDQFKLYNDDFRDNMVKLQAELELEPKPEFLEIHERYKVAVKKWLETNSNDSK